MKPKPRLIRSRLGCRTKVQCRCSRVAPTVDLRMSHEPSAASTDTASNSSTRLNSQRRSILHFLAGARPTDLARILWSHGGVSRSSAFQVVVMAACALARTPACTMETFRVARRVKNFSFAPPPVFIVGHWRSGTTYLHNLMSLDRRFSFPTISDVLRPFDFYPSPVEPISRWLILRLLPSTRPMDDVPLAPHLPQEEEIATATMGALSFLNCFYFPKRLSEVFAKEVLFHGASADELSKWSESLRYFLAKLAALSPERRLLLKNPAHSARIPHLRALFPGAKFVHIHRHPFDVFRSTQKLYRCLLPSLALQHYELSSIDEHIMWAYPKIMNLLLDSLQDIPAADVTTVSYVELLADPGEAIARIYRDLDLGDFSHVRPPIQLTDRSFRSSPSIFDMDEDTQSRLALLWKPVLDRLGYAMPTAVQSSFPPP